VEGVVAMIRQSKIILIFNNKKSIRKLRVIMNTIVTCDTRDEIGEILYIRGNLLFREIRAFVNLNFAKAGNLACACFELFLGFRLVRRTAVFIYDIQTQLNEMNIFMYQT